MTYVIGRGVLVPGVEGQSVMAMLKPKDSSEESWEVWGCGEDFHSLSLPPCPVNDILTMVLTWFDKD